MDDINKNNNELNNSCLNTNIELKNIINNTILSGSSDSYFDD